MKPDSRSRPGVEHLEGRIALSNVSGWSADLPQSEAVHVHPTARHLADRPHPRDFSSASPLAIHSHRAGHPTSDGEAPIRAFGLPPSRPERAGPPLSDPTSDTPGATTSPITAFAGSGIEASDDLWYFGGATPAYYATHITLTETRYPASSGPFQWTVTAGTSIVKITGSGGTTATLASIGASAPAPQLQFDVRIQVSLKGVVFGIARLAVARPDHLVHLRDVDNQNATYGYVSQIHYSIDDQFNRVLPRRVEVNEQWTTGVVSDFAGTNWQRGAATGAAVNPADWYDKIQGATGSKPPAKAPQTSLGNTKVEHWGQAWFVGSPTPGKGRKVQTDTLQKYQDHARHTNVVSPP